MAQKQARSICLIEGCTRLAVVGALACKDHFDVRLLQAEIERLRVTQGQGLIDLFARFPDYRGLLDSLQKLADRASASKSDEGRLGAGVAVVAGARKNLDRLLDPTDQIADPRPRCSDKACEGSHVRFSVTASFCGFCRRSLRGEETAGALETSTDQPAPRVTARGNSSNGHAPIVGMVATDPVPVVAPVHHDSPQIALSAARTVGVEPQGRERVDPGGCGGCCDDEPGGEEGSGRRPGHVRDPRRQVGGPAGAPGGWGQT